MQIFDFLRGRWLTIIIAAGVVAAIFGFIIARSTGTDRHEARAESTALIALPQDPDRFTMSVFTEQLVVEIDSVPVREEVVRVTQMSAREVEENLASEELGSAGSIVATFVADDEATAVLGLRTAVRTALLAIASRERAAVQRSATATATLATQIEAEIAQLEVEAGVSDIEDRLRDTVRRIDQIELELALSDNPAQQRALEDILNVALVDERGLRAVYPRWEAAQTELNAVRPKQTQAAVDLSESDEIIARLESDDPLSGLDTTLLSSTVASVRTGMTAGIVAAALATAVAIVVQQIKGKENDDPADGSTVGETVAANTTVPDQRRNEPVDDMELTSTSDVAQAPAPETGQSKGQPRVSVDADQTARPEDTTTTREPSEDVSNKTTPKKSAPKQNTSKKSTPKQNTSKQNTSKKTSPTTPHPQSSSSKTQPRKTSGPAKAASSKAPSSTSTAPTSASSKSPSSKSPSSKKSVPNEAVSKSSTAKPPEDADATPTQTSEPKPKVTRVDLRPWSLWEVDGEVQVKRSADTDDEASKTADATLPSAE